MCIHATHVSSGTLVCVCVCDRGLLCVQGATLVLGYSQKKRSFHSPLLRYTEGQVTVSKNGINCTTVLDIFAEPLF